MPQDYSAAVNVASRRLRPWVGSLAGTRDLEDEVLDAAMRIRGQFPCVAAAIDAQTISDDDLAWVMDAAGTLAAMNLLTTTTTLFAKGVQRIETPDFKVQFAPPTPSQRTELAENLSKSIGYISCVRAIRSSAASNFTMYSNAGPRQRASTCDEPISSTCPGIYHWLWPLFPNNWWC